MPILTGVIRREELLKTSPMARIFRCGLDLIEYIWQLIYFDARLSCDSQNI